MDFQPRTSPTPAQTAPTPQTSQGLAFSNPALGETPKGTGTKPKPRKIGTPIAPHASKSDDHATKPRSRVQTASPDKGLAAPTTRATHKKQGTTVAQPGPLPRNVEYMARKAAKETEKFKQAEAAKAQEFEELHRLTAEYETDQTNRMQALYQALNKKKTKKDPFSK